MAFARSRERPQVSAPVVVAVALLLLLGALYSSGSGGWSVAYSSLSHFATQTPGAAAVSATAKPIAAAATPEVDSATRRLVFATPWGREAVEKLKDWRSTLFTRMATFYKDEEAAASQQGAAGHIGRVEPQGVSRYNIFDGIMGCPKGQLQRLGPPGDGGKFVCVDGVLANVDSSAIAGGQKKCAIYSIGSAGDFEFEQAMLQSTACDVFTFDCTYDGQSQNAERHQYHKVCLGSQGMTKAVKAYGGAQDIQGATFMTWDQTTAMLNLTHVHLLKIDIEGFEFDVLSALKEANSCDLPLMIAMEVHFVGMYNGADATDFSNLFWSKHDVSLGELAVSFEHFANLGYALLSRENNPYGMHCCAEFSLLRVEQPAECKPFATE